MSLSTVSVGELVQTTVIAVSQAEIDRVSVVNALAADRIKATETC